MVVKDHTAVYDGRNDANPAYVAELRAADVNGRTCDQPGPPPPSRVDAPPAPDYSDSDRDTRRRTGNSGHSCLPGSGTVITTGTARSLEGHTPPAAPPASSYSLSPGWPSRAGTRRRGRGRGAASRRPPRGLPRGGPRGQSCARSAGSCFEGCPRATARSGCGSLRRPGRRGCPETDEPPRGRSLTRLTHRKRRATTGDADRRRALASANLPAHRRRRVLPSSAERPRRRIAGLLVRVQSGEPPPQVAALARSSVVDEFRCRTSGPASPSRTSNAPKSGSPALLDTPATIRFRSQPGATGTPGTDSRTRPGRHASR